LGSFSWKQVFHYIFFSSVLQYLTKPFLYVIFTSWRTTGDIHPTWQSILSILQKQHKITKYAGPGGWNDPDMLQVGNGRLTIDEQKSHFSLWAALKSPLLLGFDVSIGQISVFFKSTL
jgi:alpha-galactosidase